MVLLFLGSLFFILFINLFLIIERANICSFEDKYTMFSCINNSQTTLNDPVSHMETISTRYKLSSMKVNVKEFQLAIPG